MAKNVSSFWRPARYQEEGQAERLFYIDFLATLERLYIRRTLEIQSNISWAHS